MSIFEPRQPQEDIGITLARQELQLKKDSFVADLADRTDQAYEHDKAEREDLTRWQQDLQNILLELEYNLRNYAKSSEGTWIPKKYWTKKDGQLIELEIPPLLNRVGLSKMMSIVNLYLNRNVMMSTLTQEIIFRMMRGFAATIIFNLGENFDVYEIDQTDLKLIVKMLKDTVETTLYRALNNGERRYLNTINKRIETFADGPAINKQHGMFGSRFGG